jgi:glycosyltransferase involved in cell wall biosynthesis
MRVLHLNTHASGGSYEYAALLSSALAQQGIESRVLCKNSLAAKASRPLLDRIIRRSYVSFSTEPWHGTRRLISPPAPEELNGTDVVHLHTVADWFDVPCWLEALPRKTSVVISVHDMWHITGGCFLYRGCDRYTNACVRCPILKPPFSWVLAKEEQRRKLRAYRERRAQFVANSQWLAGLAEKSATVRACGSVRVISPGIDTTLFRHQDQQLCRNQRDLPADAFVIVTGGASLRDVNKNVPWLFEQLSRLRDLHDVIVVAFGEGAVSVPDGLNVRFTGPIRDRGDLAQLFAAADVFVSASLMETYGLTLVEAMACETPVVAFRVGGIPEAVPDRQAGLLCEPHDTSALVAAIEALRSSPRLRDELGSAGSNLAATRNSKDQFAAEFTQLYEECLRCRQTSAAGQSALVA